MPICQADEVHVWRINLNLPSAQLWQLQTLLAPDEQDRARQFRFQPDRDHFTATRGCLRLLLGRYLSIEPEALQFCYGPYGKPALQSKTEKAISFNVSHSQGWALIAVSQGQSVGIDLEKIRPNYLWQAVSRQIFSAREQAVLQALPTAAQCSAFFKTWTFKEAYVKATGEGLSMPLAQLEILEDIDTAQTTLTLQGDAEVGRRWSLQPLRPMLNYAAALATAAELTTIRCWHWNNDLFSHLETH